jgi:KRAB domain-containing zinc finger protein
LKDVFHLADPPVQKLNLSVSSASLPQHQKHHTAEKSLNRDVVWKIFQKIYEFCSPGKTSNFKALWENFPALLDFLHTQIIADGEEPNSSVFEEPFHHGKSYGTLYKCIKVSSPLRFYTGINLHESSKCEKVFHDELSLVPQQTLHTVQRTYKCRECGRSFKKRSDLTIHESPSWRKAYECRDCGKSFK